jgi:hypothetical protein
LKRRGGRDINKKFPFRSEAAGVVSSAKSSGLKHFAEPTSPSAPFFGGFATSYYLAQPPLLFKEGKAGFGSIEI